MIIFCLLSFLNLPSLPVMFLGWTGIGCEKAPAATHAKSELWAPSCDEPVKVITENKNLD
jgi:hypothetical protein